MPDPVAERDGLTAALRQMERAAEAYVDSMDESLVQPHGNAELEDRMPEEGVGSLKALTELTAAAMEAATRSSGPRFFHFVMGGGTPAALAADWLASTLDQNAYNWISSPLAARIEQISVDWLKDLFGIPAAWSGVITSGATMSNFVGLASARRWWGLEHGVDVDSAGFSGLPSMPVFASGYLHASAIKALGMLGIGRETPRILAGDASGRFDLAALERELRGLGGQPALIVATAGDVNTGDFDPLREITGLAAENHAWVHVDGAFGLFAALSPSTRHLVDGIEAAHSVAVDGHKWMNVPYDTGFAFVRDGAAHAAAFTSARPSTRARSPFARRSSTGARARPTWT